MLIFCCTLNSLTDKYCLDIKIAYIFSVSLYLMAVNLTREFMNTLWELTL